MTGYWATNPGSADALVVWDAFKVFMRGQYQTIVPKIRRERRADLTRAETEASVKEALYIRFRDPYTMLDYSP